MAGNPQITSVSLTKPSGTVAGDLLYVFISMGKGTDFVAPQGWNEITHDYGANNSFGAFYKYAGSSEPSSYTFSWTTASDACGIIGRLPAASVASSNPDDAFSYVSLDNAAGVFTASNITTTSANCTLLTAFFSRAASLGIWTLPSGETAFGSSPQSYKSGSGAGISECSGKETLGAAGVVTGRTASHSLLQSYGGAFMVAIKAPATNVIPISFIRSMQRAVSGSPIGGKVFFSWAFTKMSLILSGFHWSVLRRGWRTRLRLRLAM